MTEIDAAAAHRRPVPHPIWCINRPNQGPNTAPAEQDEEHRGSPYPLLAGDAYEELITVCATQFFEFARGEYIPGEPMVMIVLENRAIVQEPVAAYITPEQAKTLANLLRMAVSEIGHPFCVGGAA